MSEGVWAKGALQDALEPWEGEAPATPAVLILNGATAMRVRRGALEIDHGARGGEKQTRIDVSPSPARSCSMERAANS